MGRKRKSAKGLRPANPTDIDSSTENMEKEGHAEIYRGSPAKDMSVVVRRSGRLKNLVSSGPSNEGPVRTVDLNTDDSDDSDDEPPQHTDGLNTEPSPGEGGMEEKIDFLVQSVVELTGKLGKRNSTNEQKSEEVNYKELYLGAQKKIDCLTEANHELTKKLEFASGKIEAYEQMRDTFAYSNLVKVVEAVAANVSSQAGTAPKCNLPVVSPLPEINDDSRVLASSPTPAANGNNNNDNLQVVASSTPAANVDDGGLISKKKSIVASSTPAANVDGELIGRKKSRRLV